MTILIDAANQLGSRQQFINPTVATPMSMPHDVGTGSDRLLIVVLDINQGTAPTISGITYAGVAMTSAGNQTGPAPADRRTEMWYLVNPNAGTNNIVITLSGAGTTTVFTVFATGWTGVDQTTPFSNAYASASGTSTTPSVDVTTSATTDVVVDGVAAVGAGPPAVGASQTAYRNASGQNHGHSSETGSTPTVTMSWTIGSSTRWAIGGRAMKASTATSPPAAASGVQISEISVVPLRAGPLGFDVLSASSAVQQQETMYEAAGVYPKIFRSRIVDGEYIWDDIITLPTVGNAGRLAISTAPTPSSPAGSLIVVTQDAFYQYPLSSEVDPALTPYPALVTISTITSDAPLQNADLMPVFYPSIWDGGNQVYELVYVHILLQDLTVDVDKILLTYRWDDTNKWESQGGATASTLVAYSLSQNDALFEIPPGNSGSRLHLAVCIYDAVATDPVPPTMTDGILWLRKLTVPPGERGNRPARATPEDS